VEAVITGKALGLLAPADKARMAGYGTFEATIDTLEGAARSASPYLCGAQFTAADVYVGASIGWGMQFGVIEKRPAFADYVGRITSRDAYKRAIAIDDTLIAEQQPQQPAAT
jgi:glutathione S-transferase